MCAWLFDHCTNIDCWDISVHVVYSPSIVEDDYKQWHDSAVIAFIIISLTLFRRFTVNAPDYSQNINTDYVEEDRWVPLVMIPCASIYTHTHMRVEAAAHLFSCRASCMYTSCTHIRTHISLDTYFYMYTYTHTHTHIRMDWGLWLPLIASLVGVAACCSLSAVVYCWCQVSIAMSI